MLTCIHINVCTYVCMYLRYIHTILMYMYHRTSGFTSCMHVCIMHYVFFVDVEVESGCPSPLPPVFGNTSSCGGQASGRGLEQG